MKLLTLILISCFPVRRHKFVSRQMCQKNIYIVHDFRLPLWCKREFRSSEMLRGVDWQLATDVSEPIGCSEMSVTNCQSALRAIPDELISQENNCLCTEC